MLAAFRSEEAADIDLLLQLECRTHLKLSSLDRQQQQLLLESMAGPLPDEAVERALEYARCRQALAHLTDRERTVVRYYYGLEGEEAQTLEQVGRRLGVTRERERQIKAKALDKLRDTAESHERLFLVEVMGRHSGYIALYTALAGGAEVVALPETETNVAQIVQHLQGYLAAQLTDGGGQRDLLGADPYTVLGIAAVTQPPLGHDGVKSFRFVILPGAPVPILLPSSSTIGVISAAVPEKKASSDIYASSRVNRSSITSIPSSSAIRITLSLVIPSSIDVSGVVFSLLSLMVKTFSPLPSDTYPSLSRRSAS